ncbi:hypothetical protein [Lactococcus lactis]|uniref:Neutral ceramidase superfamily lipid hydrolase n=1 Tax=Lactococcus lactis TaxID=1358 RepID=A0AAW5TMT7_9LACT|nr:hypothetical protein [Lactococcus lactis]MCW2280142.1 putative neutral ceramidase superfamily lipid hydrolase [Lactococcus lactis]
MDFYMKLPRNRKDFLLFLGIVSVLSVNIIAPLITCFEIGFTIKNWLATYQIMPVLWIVVVILVLITHKPASKLTQKFIGSDNSFNAQVLINCLINVIMMSILLTIIGSWIGMRNLSLQPFEHFFYKWPRNFSISFFVEVLLAQPFARFFMYKKHLREDRIYDDNEESVI